MNSCDAKNQDGEEEFATMVLDLTFSIGVEAIKLLFLPPFVL